MRTNEGVLILGMLATSYLLVFDCAQSTALALASSVNREAPSIPLGSTVFRPPSDVQLSPCAESGQPRPNNL